MRVALTRYRVKPGKTAEVERWMATLNTRRADCLATLPREQMYVEAVFRETVGGEEFLYWFCVQGEGGAPVTTSDHDLDRVHLAFWADCIDRTYPHTDLALQLALIPPHILAQMCPEAFAAPDAPG